MAAIGALERLNAFINNSATITEVVGTAGIKNPVHRAVMYDNDGNVVMATNGNQAIGMVLSNTLEPKAAGERVHILIKQIGLLEAGSPIAKGDFVTINANGQGIPATSGSFIFGRAFTAADTGEAVQVQINQMGRMA